MRAEEGELAQLPQQQQQMKATRDSDAVEEQSSSPPDSSKLLLFLSTVATRTFPDRTTRVFALLAFIVALAGFGVWLSFVVRNRLLAATASPATTFSVEPASTLPPIRALRLPWGGGWSPLYVNTSFEQFQTVFPFLNLAVGFSEWNFASYTFRTSQLQCDTYMLFNPMTICLANTPVPRNLTDSPESFSDGSSILLVEFTYFYNLSAIPNYRPEDMAYLDPFLASTVEVMSESSLRQLADLAPITYANTSNEAVQTAASLLKVSPGVITFRPNVANSVNVQMSKTVRLDGSEEWRQVISAPNVTPQPPANNEAIYQQLLLRMAGDPVKYQQILALKADPSMQFGYFLLEIEAGSFNVQVIREYLNYNWLTFLSDIGGLLSITFVVLSQLFPPRHRQVVEREFIGLAIGRWICGGGETKDTEAKEQQTQEMKPHTQSNQEELLGIGQLQARSDEEFEAHSTHEPTRL